MIAKEFKTRQQEISSKEPKIARNKLKRVFYYIVGSISLILGIIGIAIPILPTTPFLLIAAACYFRSSEKAYNWLIYNKVFGKIIRDYREGKGLSIKVKIITIILLWITIIISMLFINIVWVQVLLVVIAVLVSIHIILIKPKKSQ